MAESFSSGTADAVLNAIFNATSYSEAGIWMQLHTGAPGAAGTANVATETDRQAVSCSTASGGAITSDTLIQWTAISGSEDATHFTLWDASTVGNFVGSGTITANAYTAGDTFNIPVGDFDVSLTIAS